MGIRAIFACILCLCSVGVWADNPPAGDGGKPKSRAVDQSKKKATSQPATPKKKKKKAKPRPKRTYKKAPPYSSPKEMSPSAKREMTGRRYQLYQKKKLVIGHLRCGACKGKGRRNNRVFTPQAGGTVSDEEVRGICPSCRGARIVPSVHANRVLADYFAYERAFRRDYLFAGNFDTGLTTWIHQHVNNTIALKILNGDAARRLKAGKIAIGDVFLVGIEVFKTHEEKGVKLLQATLDPIFNNGDRSNLFVMLRDKVNQNASQNFFMLVVYDGPTEYENIFGDKLKAEVMTCLGWKKIRVPKED